MCGFGSEPRPGDNSPVIIKFRDIIDLGKVRREDLSYAGGGLIAGWDIGTFCQFSPQFHYQPVRGPADSIVRAFNGVVDEIWRSRCRCKPPPEIEDIKGGQCDAFYDVVLWGTGLDYVPPHRPRRTQDSGGRGRGPLRFRFTRTISGSSGNIESLRCTVSDRFGVDLATQTAEPYKPGTAKMNFALSRTDGRPDDCGNPSDSFPIEPVIPDGTVIPPLDPESICPPCSCPAPGVLFIPTPVPVPPVIIPVPIPVPIPAPPLPAPPCVCPEPLPIPEPVPPPLPPPPPPPKEPEKVDCCPEILSRLGRLQSDVLAIRDTDIPDVKQHFDDRLDGLIECLDFNQLKLGPEVSLGSGVTGTVALPARAIAIKLTAATPTPSNRSLRQDGGDTPDVIQGGWCWLRYGGGMYLRTPLDAEQKLVVIPAEMRALKPLSFQWRGVHAIAYNVIAITAPDRAAPPYEDRPCQK